MSICEAVTATSRIPLEDTSDKLSFLLDYDQTKGDMSMELLAVKGENELIWMTVPIQTTVTLEKNATIFVRLNLLDHLNALKISLSTIIE
jgi:hypothetical protein